MRKTIAWWVGPVIGLLAVVTANTYEESWKNLVSFSPLLTTISNALIAVLTKHFVQIIATAAAFGYLGYRTGRVIERRTVVPVAPTNNPSGNPILNPYNNRMNRPTLDELTYSVREVIEILSREGPLDTDNLDRNLGRIKAEHPAYAIQATYNVRNKFISVAEEARAARKPSSNHAYNIIGDFPVNKRDHYVNSLNNLGNKFIAELNSRGSRMTVRQAG